MAKALMGYVGGTDPRRTQQSRTLRQRIADLEAEVSRLKQENDALDVAYREAVAAVAAVAAATVSAEQLVLATH